MMKMSVHNSPIETINENNLIKTHECIPQKLTSLLRTAAPHHQHHSYTPLQCVVVSEIDPLADSKVVHTTSQRLLITRHQLAML